jgi:hypothetical protein
MFAILSVYPVAGPSLRPQLNGYVHYAAKAMQWKDYAARLESSLNKCSRPENAKRGGHLEPQARR